MNFRKTRVMVTKIVVLVTTVFVLFAAHGYTTTKAIADVLMYPEDTIEAEAPVAEASLEATQDIGTMILSMQSVLPEGTPFTNEANVWVNYPTWPFEGRGCTAFAMLVSDSVYGAMTPVQFLDNESPENILVGDVVRIGNNHSVVVYAVDDTSITVCEGNYNSAVHWGRVITKASLEGQVTYIARRVPATAQVL